MSDYEMFELGRVVLQCGLTDGWYLVRTWGAHRQIHHPTKLGTVTEMKVDK